MVVLCEGFVHYPAFLAIDLCIDKVWVHNKKTRLFWVMFRFIWVDCKWVRHNDNERSIVRRSWSYLFMKKCMHCIAQFFVLFLFVAYENVYLHWIYFLNKARKGLTKVGFHYFRWQTMTIIQRRTFILFDQAYFIVMLCFVKSESRFERFFHKLSWNKVMNRP